MKSTPKKVEVLKAKKPPFVITVTIEGVPYEGKGETALAALQAIPTPELITTGNLVITHGEKSKEMLYAGNQLKRIFNPYHQDVLITDIMAGL